MYRDYLTWRRGDGSRERLSAAANAVPKSYFRYLGTVAHDGSHVFYMLCAYFHKSIPAEQFVLGICHTIDTNIPYEDECQLTILADARQYDGAYNFVFPK